MPDDDQKVLDALRDASTLYQRYVDLAKIAEIPVSPEDEGAAEVERSWDHPLGLTIVTSG